MSFRCPICEEYQKPTPGAVQGHISGSSAGEHSGASGMDYSEEDLRVDAADGDSEATDGQQAAADGSGAQATAESSGASSDPPEPEGGCPECGGDESVKPTALLRDMGVEPGQVPGAAEYDHACRECTKREGQLVVWNE